jgi:hypothetical protein
MDEEEAKDQRSQKIEMEEEYGVKPSPLPTMSSKETFLHEIGDWRFRGPKLGLRVRLTREERTWKQFPKVRVDGRLVEMCFERWLHICGKANTS